MRSRRLLTSLDGREHPGALSCQGTNSDVTREAQARSHGLKQGPVVPSPNHRIARQYARGALGDAWGLRVVALYKQVRKPLNLLPMAHSTTVQQASALGLGDPGD